MWLLNWGRHVQTFCCNGASTQCYQMVPRRRFLCSLNPWTSGIRSHRPEVTLSSPPWKDPPPTTDTAEKISKQRAVTYSSLLSLENPATGPTWRMDRSRNYYSCLLLETTKKANTHTEGLVFSNYNFEVHMPKKKIQNYVRAACIDSIDCNGVTY